MSTFLYAFEHFEVEQEMIRSINPQIIKFVLVYQYLTLQRLNRVITIDDTLKEYHGETGLIGPGGSCMTHCLKKALW